MKKIKNKNQENENLYSNKGITLITLVITIIILIILAGVTINLTLGNSGLFENVKYAKKYTENAQATENGLIQEYINVIDQYIEGDEEQPKELLAEMFEFTPSNTNWNVKNVKEALDYLYNK
jgi:type II secretory pathway pseudopilin PulG